MNDIFLSYDSNDRAIAQRLADGLEALGWSVWWDREIPFGKAFDLVIEEQLNAARCVVVVWSKASVGSRWVKTEAAVAAERDCLVPILIDDATVPLEFRRIQTAMMQGWNGEAHHPEFVRLVDALRGMVGPAPRPAAPAKSAVPMPPSPTRSRTRHTWAAAIAIIAVVALAVLGVATKERVPTAAAPPTVLQAEGAAKGVERSAESDRAAPKVHPASAAGADGIAISIGDMVSEGVPRPGAGNIESPGAEDVYRFTAAPGQRVYFHMFEYDKNMGYVKWKLTDPDGGGVFDACLGCSTPGVQTLRKGGAYVLRVGGQGDPATGVYRFKLFNVPPPGEFTIRVGDTVSENVPGPGAGNIESPGAEDSYRFAATAGQRVYFHMYEYDKDMGYLKWRLADADGGEIFNACLGCTTPGRHILRKGGTYVLKVGSANDPSTGIYRFKLFNVLPAHQFSIKVGDAIRENVPGPGAGNIESPGAEDIYIFSAAAGQRVYFQVLEHEQTIGYVKWRLADQDGIEIFDTCLGCSTPGAQTLRKGGAYTLTVGNKTEPGTGVYRLQITNVTGAGG